MHSEESGGPSHRRIVTIGVYGFTEAAFFQALLDAGVDSFCDVRARRGVRGSRYAFSNSRRLQARLADLGIEYHHFPNLAPTAEIREIQKTADKDANVAKRKRTALDETFVQAYKSEVLKQFDPSLFTGEAGARAKTIALFCVEREPGACHRSIIAAEIEAALDLEIEHIVPVE